VGALIYVETSIPTFYFETRPAVEHRARRKWTREWWELASVRDTLVTSLAALIELERAPQPKSGDGLALLAALPLLESTVEVDDLVTAYLAHKLMPRDAAGDARHLALATFHGCDALATWNCRHIANLSKQAHVRRVNGTLGYATPALVTPLELLEAEA
jgi:predicted nucleic acid-binding protein